MIVHSGSAQVPINIGKSIKTIPKIEISIKQTPRFELIEADIPHKKINMKFAAVVVLLALALGAKCNLITYSAHTSPLTYTAQGPFVNGAPVVSTYSAAPVVAAAPVAYSAPIAYSAPAPIAYSAPASIAYSTAPVVAAPVVAAQGSYVAQTRGSVHVAPLPGHAQSAASVNLQPAPGTL